MIRRADYFHYHRQLQLGIVDEVLLERMIYDLGETVEEIARLTQLRHYPNSGKDCDTCGTLMEFYEGTPDHLYGYWLCEDCGALDDWWDYLESHDWHYSDCAEGLVQYFCEMERATGGVRRVLFERVLQIYHLSGPLTPWLIEGGTATLDAFRATGELDDFQPSYAI